MPGRVGAWMERVLHSWNMTVIGAMPHVIRISRM